MEEWKRGKRHGISLSWHSPHQLRERVTYHNGQEISSIKFDPSGKLWERKVSDTGQIGEPGGPANGSQPIRSETNRKSAAAGSRR
jgi:antitoxin component YwqK of YwqJK toxin-antitoxin module